MGISLRKAVPEDAFLITNTRKLAWEQTYRGIYPDHKIVCYDYAYHLNRDQMLLSDPQQHYYLFLDGDRCVGYFSFGPYNYGTYKDFKLCLNSLYVLDGYKGMGLGKKAFAVLREFCFMQGIDRFFCGCNANNGPAISFYDHMGGIQGDRPCEDAPKQEQIIHFEFYLKD